MAKYDYNIVSIGAGSAGLVTSYIGAILKAKVALIERHKMGGDCLNTGCVPSKALIKTAKVIQSFKEGPLPLRASPKKSSPKSFCFNSVIIKLLRNR